MKRLLSLFMAVILMSGITSCQPNRPQEQAPQLQKVKVLLDWFPNTNHAGLYAAREKGYYAEEGLDVEIIQPAEGGTAQLIAANQGEFGISYQEEVTLARAANLPITAIAAVVQHNTSGFASPLNRQIKTPLDFQGKTYGGWGSPSENAMLKALMIKYGGDFSKIKIINIGAADFFTSVQKDIDFSWIYYGWTGIEAEQKGMHLNFIPLRSEGPAFDFYTPVIIASEATINTSPHLVEKFMRATTRGYQLAISDPDAVSALMVKAVPELDANLVSASMQYLAKQYQADAPRWGEMKKETWDAYTAFLLDNKLMDAPVDSDKAFTNRFLTQ